MPLEKPSKGGQMGFVSLPCPGQHKLAPSVHGSSSSFQWVSPCESVGSLRLLHMAHILYHDVPHHVGPQTWPPRGHMPTPRAPDLGSRRVAEPPPPPAASDARRLSPASVPNPTESPKHAFFSGHCSKPPKTPLFLQSGSPHMLLSFMNAIVFFSSRGSFTPFIFWKVHAARSENLPSALFLWQFFSCRVCWPDESRSRH